jgi:hypothetical protein
MELTKDTYSYLMQFADDRTILNFLSTKKKFQDSFFFENVVRRKYKGMVKFKKDETWKNFYLKIIKFLSTTYENDKIYIEEVNVEKNIIYVGIIIENNTDLLNEDNEPDFYMIDFSEDEKEAIEKLYLHYIYLIDRTFNEIYDSFSNPNDEDDQTRPEDVYKNDLALPNNWKDKNIFTEKLKNNNLELKFDMSYPNRQYQTYDFILIKYIPS